MPESFRHVDHVRQDLGPGDALEGRAVGAQPPQLLDNLVVRRRLQLKNLRNAKIIVETTLFST